MAIVEDGDINESEEENKVEVIGLIVEDDDSWDEESEVDLSSTNEIYERRAEELQLQIEENPFNCDLHLRLLHILSNLSGFDRWRDAFIKLHALTPIKENIWGVRLSTEIKLAATNTNFIDIPELFLESCHDCYSPLILTDWCQWAVTLPTEEEVRAQFKEILRKGGADPFDGQSLWDAAAEYETKLLGELNETDEKYKDQAERVLYYLEEMVSRPLLNAERGLVEFEVMALRLHDQKYVDKVKKQHDISQEFLQHLIEYEEKIQTLSNIDAKCNVYIDYIEKVKELAKDKDRYGECDTNGVLRVLYDRATCECAESNLTAGLFAPWTRVGRRGRSWVMTCRAVCRRRPQSACGWEGAIKALEQVGKDFEEIKTLFETALGDLESFKDTQKVWMAYLEYVRRITMPEDEQGVDRLRKTFRLAWDSLTEQWGEAANECDVALFWARLEYNVLGCPRDGKEIIEEIFTYGRNKSMSKYWETLLHLEAARDPQPSYNKYREQCRRAVTNVTDYPYTVANLWLSYERERGSLQGEMEASDVCEEKIAAWQQEYQTRNKNERGTTSTNQSKTSWVTHKTTYKPKNLNEKPKGKGKRKLDSKDTEGGKKKKLEGNEGGKKGGDSKSNNLKRSHEEDVGEGSSTKRPRQEETKVQDFTKQGDSKNLEACTLFVSNLDFKVDEQKLREKLSEFGNIMSLRIRAGVKSFGGSICYCQYDSVESVENAIKHDRSPLEGRPMFLSRFGKRPQFKYNSGVLEKHKLFVRDLPRSITEPQLREIFEPFGELKDIRIVTFKDGTPKGLAYIEYVSEQSASAALKTDGTLVDGRTMHVAISAPPAKTNAPDDSAPTTRRRTQLSSFIPSVLQRPSTSGTKQTGIKPAEQPTDKPKSNSDFRDMLLNK